MLPEYRKDLSDELVMMFLSIGKDENIIEIDNNMSIIDKVLEDVVHEVLERRRRIGKAEEHDSWFVESAISPKSCFPFIAFFDAYVVVPPSDIKLCEELGIFCPVEKFLNER